MNRTDKRCGSSAGTASRIRKRLSTYSKLKPGMSIRSDNPLGRLKTPAPPKATAPWPPSDVVIDNNTFNGVGGSGFGFECDRYLEEESTLSYTNNQVNDLERGFHLNYVDSGGTLDVSGNTFNATAVSAVNVENAHYGCVVTITENMIAGGGATGVRFDDIRDGCVVLITNNEIREFSGDGVAVVDVYYAIVDIEENTIVGNSAVHGIYHHYSEAAILDVRFNDVSGFDRPSPNGKRIAPAAPSSARAGRPAAPAS